MLLLLFISLYVTSFTYLSLCYFFNYLYLSLLFLLLSRCRYVIYSNLSLHPYLFHFFYSCTIFLYFFFSLSLSLSLCCCTFLPVLTLSKHILLYLYPSLLLLFVAKSLFLRFDRNPFLFHRAYSFFLFVLMKPFPDWRERERAEQKNGNIFIHFKMKKKKRQWKDEKTKKWFYSDTIELTNFAEDIFCYQFCVLFSGTFQDFSLFFQRTKTATEASNSNELAIQ